MDSKLIIIGRQVGLLPPLVEELGCAHWALPEIEAFLASSNLPNSDPLVITPSAKPSQEIEHIGVYGLD